MTLRVLGVDLNDEQTLERIAECLSELVWYAVDGVVRATVFTDGDLACAAIEAARRIEHRLTGAKVDQVDDDLVGLPDIAARLGLNRETVRSWTNGSRGPGGFPAPVGHIGGGERGAARVWRWSDANEWLAAHYSLGDGYCYPSDAERAEVNAYLAKACLPVAVQNGPAPELLPVNKQAKAVNVDLILTGAAGVWVTGGQVAGVQTTVSNSLVGTTSAA